MDRILQAVLAFTLLSATVEVGETEGEVSFWMADVTLTCPGEGYWFNGKGRSVGNGSAGTYTYHYTGNRDVYFCNTTTHNKIYHFYIQGKACENCFELDAAVFAVVIVADVVGTTIVMLLVFKCSKRTAGGPQQTSAGTEIPLSPYEPLRTRSEDPYSFINRTG